MKKWLSYRERPLLGRDLKPDEARYVTEMARRIAAILLLEPALDANYERVKADTYDWSRLAPAGEPSMICPQCGKQASGTSAANCGARLPQEPPAVQRPVLAAASTVRTTTAHARPPSAPAPPASPCAGSFAFARQGSRLAYCPVRLRLCPVCAGSLHETDVKGLFHTKHELVCGHCGAVFVDHGGQPRSASSLADTRNPAASPLAALQHQTLSAPSGSASPPAASRAPAPKESDLAEAMTELQSGQGPPPAPGRQPDPAEGRRADALRADERQPARAALGDQGRLRRALGPRRQGPHPARRWLPGAKPRGAQGARSGHARR